MNQTNPEKGAVLPNKNKPALQSNIKPPSDLSPAKTSIFYKTLLSKYLSPYANIMSSPNDLSVPDYDKNPPYLQPHIKFVPYGTGTGKSYSAMNEYMRVQSMDCPDIPESNIYKRSPSQHGFTNAIFVTPNKNQITFNDDLVKTMLSKGITPLSVFGLTDMQTHSTRLWLSGRHTIEERLWDYIATSKRIITLAKTQNVSGMHLYHLTTLCDLIHKLSAAVANIKDVENKYLTNKFNSDDDYEKEKRNAARQHDQYAQNLVKAILNNLYNARDAEYNNFNPTAFEDESLGYLDDADYDSYLLDDALSEAIGIQGMNPIDEDDVFNEIFLPAKEKPHFDDLVGRVLDAKTDSYVCMLATLKKDILRVYAPLNYATYLPSFICMTSNKFRMRAGMYRKSKAAGSAVKPWTMAIDFDSYAELIGNKQEARMALTSIPSSIPDARQKQLQALSDTLMRPRTDNRESGGSDDRSQFAKNDIDFYVIIDEANGLFEYEFIGDTLKRGVIKPIMDDFSVTDLISCVVRKYREFRTQPKDSIDCYAQNEFFFAAMYAYMDQYCEINPEKVLSLKSGHKNQDDDWLMQFDFPPNILYIDNNESFSITDIVKNAFSVSAKQFIDKQNLESIYFCSRGQHRYLSRTRSSDKDITLYELYQIIIAMLFAAIRFEDTDQSSGFTPDERQAFRLDLGGGTRTSKVKRQNEPFAALLAFAKGHAKQYRQWLEGAHLRNEPDACIDDWFTYMQTKLLFTLNRNKTFDSSPDVGHGLKVFIDIKLHLVTHHPEVEILRSVVGTKNHLHLMSATSGKTHAYSGQYNIDFIKKWGGDLGVKVTLPEYDAFHKLDYREIFADFRAHRASMRSINIIGYKDASDAEKLLIRQNKPASGRLGRRKPLSPSELKNRLMTTHKSVSNNPVFLPEGSFNDKALDNAFVGLFLALQKPDSTLHISYRSDLFKLLFDSMKTEFSYRHPNTDKLNHAIKDKQTSVTFHHSIFGEFQLPLLNIFLEEQAHKKSNKLPDVRRVSKDVSDKYIYMADFYDFESLIGAAAGKIARLALYDSSIDKLVADYRTHFIADSISHKGEVRDVYTTVVSYNKAAALGLNNVIDNRTTGLNEDVNRLFISSLAYWSDINSSSGNDDDMGGFNKVENSLVYMRYCAANASQKPILISEFDSNLTSAAADSLIRHEHNLQKSNNFKQTLGRPEREDSRSGFESEIILPNDDLKEQAKVNYISYRVDQNGHAHRDVTDYAFMSMNNDAVFQHGMTLIGNTSTTPENRRQLENDTRKSNAVIERFTAFDGLMGNIIQAARNGNASDDARILADAAIEFDTTYRQPCILLSPKLWLEALARTKLISDPEIAERLGWHADEIMDCLIGMYINPSDYSNTGTLELYPLVKGVKTVGLTDFFGKHDGSIKPYNPADFVLKRVDRLQIASDDAQFSRLIDFNNSVAIKRPNQESDDDHLVLHPAMLHMALGNLGERVFEQFLGIYNGSYINFSTNDIISKFGYGLYEFFDFWLKNTKTKSWVCVDVKNQSHKENVHQTKRLHASANRKAGAIEDKLANSRSSDIDAAVDQMSTMTDFFSDSNEIHLVFLNVREGGYSNTRHIKRTRTIDGRDITVNIYYMCLFQRVLYIEPAKRKLMPTTNEYGNKPKPPSRQKYLTINPKLIELLSIEKSQGILDSFTSIADVTKTDDYDMTEAVASIFRDSIYINQTNSKQD